MSGSTSTSAGAPPVYAVESLVIDLYTPTLSVRAVDGVFRLH